MTFDRKTLSRPPLAPRKLAEVESGIEPVQDGRVYIDPPPNCRERIKSVLEPLGSRGA
jgi:hypothetical protein